MVSHSLEQPVSHMYCTCVWCRTFSITYNYVCVHIHVCICVCVCVCVRVGEC